MTEENRFFDAILKLMLFSFFQVYPLKSFAAVLFELKFSRIVFFFVVTISVRMNSNHTFRPRHDRGSIRPSGPAFRRCVPSGRAISPDESAIMPSPSGMIV